MSDAVTPSIHAALAGISHQPASLPKAGALDTLATMLGVFLPTVAKGVIMRRPIMLAIADALDLDRRAIRCMQRLRAAYGSGPLLLKIPGRSLALILDPGDVHRVLAQSPEPFATATPEKTAALTHFEPKMALISKGAERSDRRRFNEQILEAHRPVHRMGRHFREIVAEEANRLLANVARHQKLLGWTDFSQAWFRIVRRVIFGDAAAEDNALSVMMARLRFTANWAFLRPQKRDLRRRLLAHIRGYLNHPDPNSLADLATHIPITPKTAPEHQVPQWLFAFDPAGMAAFRSLALLATHSAEASAARQEISSVNGEPRVPHRLRATVLESLRLWPTSPLILRETGEATTWGNGIMPRDTGVVIFSPFFHRDDERLSYANMFFPELWISEQQNQEAAALIPFSEGPAVCPGRELVLLLTTAMLSELLANRDVQLQNPNKLAPEKPLPATLNHYRLRFKLA